MRPPVVWAGGLEHNWKSSLLSLAGTSYGGAGGSRLAEVNPSHFLVFRGFEFVLDFCPTRVFPPCSRARRPSPLLLLAFSCLRLRWSSLLPACGLASPSLSAPVRPPIVCLLGRLRAACPCFSPCELCGHLHVVWSSVWVACARCHACVCGPLPCVWFLPALVYRTHAHATSAPSLKLCSVACLAWGSASFQSAFGWKLPFCRDEPPSG